MLEQLDNETRSQIYELQKQQATTQKGLAE